MSDTVLVVGGGLAGLSAGIHALRNGYAVTILEHGLALGGVCTSWQRAPYVVDGCIHWLTGGPFFPLYEELGITKDVPIRVLEHWQTYRDARDGTAIDITRDLDALVTDLARLAPDDRAELDRIRAGARELLVLAPSMEAREVLSLRERIQPLWEMRGALGEFLHFRKPLGAWAEAHLSSPRLRRFVTQIVPAEAPAMFLPIVLGYLERGYLSRPVGGTAAFRDSLAKTFRALGGEVRLHSTVDEILVADGRATGVRMGDGTMLPAHAVISAASTPETVLRLLGGRFEAGPTQERLLQWKLFPPIVMASFGVEQPLAGQPALQVIDGTPPLEVGGFDNDCLRVRLENDDPSFAPPGHAVVQALFATDYGWWATRGSRYHDEKDAVAEKALGALEPWFPGIRAAVRMTDVATPLTYWNKARSWRGAYEGWMPGVGEGMPRVEKTLKGLTGLYLGGQWVEPGGGVPNAIVSGRRAVQILCSDDRRTFRPS